MKGKKDRRKPRNEEERYVKVKRDKKSRKNEGSFKGKNKIKNKRDKSSNSQHSDEGIDFNMEDDDEMDMIEDKKEKKVPRTIENTREYDETLVACDDEEVEFDLEQDEMADHFRLDSNHRNPKVLITTSDNPHTRTIQLGREFKQIIPRSEFRFRNRSSIQKIIRGSIKRGYSDVMVLNENRREPNGLLLIHLPNGPTASFRLSSVKLTDQVKNAVKPPPFNRPEVILNNFNTRLGYTVGRMFSCLFPTLPRFQYSTVCTFHNQRDYIFFRYHRYNVDTKRPRVNLQECGPQFSLKLMYVQKGTFDPKYGEYEWMLKRHEMQTSRKRFYL